MVAVRLSVMAAVAWQKTKKEARSELVDPFLEGYATNDVFHAITTIRRIFKHFGGICLM